MIKELPFGFPRVFGFSDGRRSRGRYPIEYYFSQGMQHSLFGLSTGYQIAKAVDSVDISGLGTIKWFADTGGKVYGVADDGKIYYEQDPGIADWALIRSPGAGYAGQGLVGDQKGRLLYFGATVIGNLNGDPTVPGNWTDSWKTGLTSYAHPADTYEDMVLFGNKSTVGLIDSADNVNLSAFTLPSAMTVDCLRSGKTGILIGANLGNRGALILWNTQTDRSIAWIWTNSNIQSIERTDSGWIVITQKKILLTNGYTVRELFPILDDPLGFTTYTVAPQGTQVINNKLFILNQYSSLNPNARVKAGLYLFDLTTALFEFVPVSTMNTYSVVPLAIYAPKTSTQEVFISYSDNFLSKKYIGKFSVFSGANGVYIPEILADSSPTEKTVEAVVVNLSPGAVRSDVQPLTFTISVKVYTFKRQLWNLNITNAAAAAGNQIRVDGRPGSRNAARIGDEVTVLEGLNAGKVGHITAIANQGLVNETWTLDTTFANNTENAVSLTVQPFQLIEKKTITAAADIPELYFNGKNNPRGKKFLVKILIENASVQLEVHRSLFLVDDLGLTT
jgi:hypothetical protein